MARISSLRALDPWGSASWWLLLQQALAATVAWLLATLLAGHPAPFFASVAAVVALNTDLGRRGSNALRLLLGVVVGIVAGEVAVAALGSGVWAIGTATVAAMALARALDRARIVMAQAAAAAILTVATAAGQEGLDRLVDALIGAGVALVFTQLLFSPEPVALIRRAQQDALTAMAEGLDQVATAMEQGDRKVAEQALATLRELRGGLAELALAARSGQRVVRHSLLWRRRQDLVVAEGRNAAHLDLLGGSCLLLARITATKRSDELPGLAREVRELQELVHALAADRTSPRSLHQVIRRAAALAAVPDRPAISMLIFPETALRVVAADIEIFARSAQSSVD